MSEGIKKKEKNGNPPTPEKKSTRFSGSLPVALSVRNATGCAAAHFHSSSVCACPTSSEIFRPHIWRIRWSILLREEPTRFPFFGPRCWWGEELRFRISSPRIHFSGSSSSYRTVIFQEAPPLRQVNSIMQEVRSVGASPLFHYLNRHVIALWISQ